MVFSLVKDVLGFAWRHRGFFFKTIAPMLFVLVLIFEMSGANTFAMNMMSQSAAVQDYKQTVTASDTTESKDETQPMSAMERQQAADDDRASIETTNPDIQVQQVELEPLSAMGVVLFVVYLLGGLYPTAIVIHYVRSVFAAEEVETNKLHSRASALWGRLLGIYLLVWGGLLLMFAGGYGILHALGLAQLGGSLIVSVLFGLGLYIHHRLSLAPYFCATTGMDIIDGLKASWKHAQGYVFTLIMGHLVLYLAVIFSLSLIGQVLQTVVSEGMTTTIQFVISVLAGFGGILQTIYVYRIYSLIQEKGQ